MAKTNAVVSAGILISVGDGGGPEIFTPLAEVLDLTPPSDAVDIVDATHQTSPNLTKEFLAGFSDPGECSFDIAFTPGAGDDTVIQGLRGSGAETNYRITWPGGSTWTFAAIFQGYVPAAPLGERMTATVTLKVTSSYTVA